MATLQFRYSTMNAGKSLEILKIANNYREHGRDVLIFTSVVDTRYGVGKVTSRVGISEDAIALDEKSNPYDIVLDHVKNKILKLSCVLVDESQFLHRDHILDFAYIVDKLNIPVICYGLKNDYRNQLFEGSKWLLTYADKIEEVRTVCSYCDKKATMILKLKDGKPIYFGEQVEIGGNELYKSVCRSHYYEPIIK